MLSRRKKVATVYGAAAFLEGGAGGEGVWRTVWDIWTVRVQDTGWTGKEVLDSSGVKCLAGYELAGESRADS